MGWKCIAIHWFVLQRRGLRLYRNTAHCIVIAGPVGYWTVSRHRAATWPARPRHGVGACVAGALGARLGMRGAQEGAQGEQVGARHEGAGAARALGVLLANRLCTRCTQPIFDPV